MERIGKYAIQRKIGSGSFGTVFLGRDEALDRLVAIKVPLVENANPTDSETVKSHAQFLSEARAAAQIKHPFVCEIYEVGEADGLPYFVMPFIESTLADEIVANKVYPPETALARARDIALGLDAAHSAGIIHRDLKPANVLLNKADQRVLIIDFGIAKRTDATATTSVLGTPLYMSPEQWHPKVGQKITPQTDLYSLGAILYQMLTGSPPFTCDGPAVSLGLLVVMDPARPPSTVNPRISSRYDALCLRALEKAPADRYPSAKAFAEALDRALQQHPDPIPPPPPKYTPAEENYKVGMEYYHGIGVRTDFSKAGEYFKTAAALDYAPAQAFLGYLYENGIGVATDGQKAFIWYEKAAARGNAHGLHNLGVLYRHGRFVARDFAKARELFEKAAAKGYAPALANLGSLYEHGYGVGRDSAKARELYEKAAAKGDMTGQAFLAELLENGKGGLKDVARALELYRKAAKQGLQYAKDALKRLGQPE